MELKRRNFSCSPFLLAKCTGMARYLRVNVEGIVMGLFCNFQLITDYACFPLFDVQESQGR